LPQATQKHSRQFYKKLRIIFTKLFKVSGWVLAVLLPLCLAFYTFYEPDIDDELTAFKSGFGYCYSGSITNSSVWKHADKLVFKSNFENGRIETFDIKPSCDAIEHKPAVENPKKEGAEFSLIRLSRQESCGIQIIVVSQGDLKEDIRISWGTRKTKRVIPKPAGEKELRIFHAGISTKEREKAFKSNAGKIR